jgi:phenylalanyl-tRNA synthetase beta chain
VGATLRKAGGDILESVWLFDVYRGERLGRGRRSLAFRLRFRAADHTLDDAELAGARARTIEAVRRSHAGELRS